ncbi:sensor histidine kinase [Saccharibacillus sacchari]|uniref:Sensor histidine kinase n=1 Tax=Saccharibacillus sacchari TaxID=456493 RepID=A0ACC6PE96_9BACL
MTGLRKLQKRLPKSIFVKLSAAFILVGLVPLFALSLFSVQTFSNYVVRYTTGNLQQMIMYMSYNLDTAFRQYDDISKLMYTGRYEGFSETMSRNQTYNVNELEQINEAPIDSFLKTVLYSDTYITAAYFVRQMDGNLYYQDRENHALQIDLLPLEQRQTDMEPQPNRLAIFPAHKDTYFVGSTREVFTVARNLIDTSGTLNREPKVVGTLFFDVDTSLFRQFSGELALGEQDELVLVDGERELFFSKQGIESARSILSGNRNREMMVLEENVPYLQGELIAGVHRAALFEQLFSARTTVYLAILIGAAALVTVGAWFSRRLSAPIRRLMKQMAIVESGRLEPMPPPRSEDEIGRLTHSFNTMVERLQTHIEQAYVAQIKQKQTELSALKSQIRPHYLYNTLEVIRMNAVDKEADEVADMIHSLANQLKYVIDYGEERVSLAQEIEHLQDYFYIISVRYDNRYTLRFEISPEVEVGWPVVKLCLQPIVENAIQHGLRKSKKGTVLIAAAVQNNDLHITVHDDGSGMSAETLFAIEQVLDAPSMPGRSIGLKNVHERIRSQYGEAYGLSVTSREGVGTSVLLRFPIAD